MIDRVRKGWVRALADHRYLIARRVVQVSVVALFIAGYRTDWLLFGREVIEGDLSASLIFGAVPLADPLAALQIWLTGHGLLLDTVLGALIVLAFYWLVGGRAFCAWVCPVNPVADGAAWLRARLRVHGGLRFDKGLKYGLLVMALLLSLLTGVTAFEWISPIGMLHRELIYGMQLGWMAAAAVFLFDLFLLRQGWCGHLCPLGAFYSLLGRFSPLRVGFRPEACTHCGDCHKVCPEPQVLTLRGIAPYRRVVSGNCTNCGRCITHCGENALAFRWVGGEVFQRPRMPEPEEEPAGRTGPPGSKAFSELPAAVPEQPVPAGENFATQD